MNDLIIHRGPDDDGVYVHENVGMGMRRLSIIDLSTGHQPMRNDDNSIVIVFNGEIYNYKELKLELENEGVVFKTRSDTEVILRLYEKYAEQLLVKLNGMFAFSIHDQRKNQIIIARDRFGEKPLYYYHSDEKITWASELKSIVRLFPELKVISEEALALYFSLTYIPAPYSIYQDIYKLLPGHYLKLDTVTLSKYQYQYWDVDPATKPDPGISYEDAKGHIYNLLAESVQQRMIADVPLGVFLSGGVDSTIVASLMTKLSGRQIKTFSVGYKDKRYDESARAKQVANHIKADHHEYILNYEDIYGSIDQIILNYDEPFADSSCLPTYFVSSKTAQHVKVALTGDGADEVFCGYNKYMLPQYRKLYQKYVPAFARNLLTSKAVTGVLSKGSSKSILSKINKVSKIINSDLVPAHLDIIAMGFRQHQLDRLLTSQPNYRALVQPYADVLKPDSAELNQTRYLDKQISLEGDMLVKVDRASMLCSLECRAPFLDHRLMEYALQLPDHYLIQKNNKKRILKDTFEHLLPKDFFNAPKSGFEIPVAQWFREGLRTDLIATLNNNNIEAIGRFQPAYVQQLIDEHLSLKANHGHLLWTLYCFVKWYNANMN